MNRIEINCQTGEQAIVPLTQSEIDEINSRPPEDQKVVAKRQISEIERETLMNRAVREFLLLSAEAQAAAQGITPAKLYAANPAYKSVKDVETQIVALRAKTK